MRFTIRALSWALASAALLAIAACSPPDDMPESPTEEPAAIEESSTAPEAPPREPVTFTATDFAYQGPTSIPAGLTQIDFVNEGESSHGLIVIGLAEGKTLQDVLAILEVEGPIPDWVSFSGGLGGIPPGGRASFVYEFQPGPHAVFSFESAPGEEITDAQKGMIQELEVTESDGTAAALPEEDLSLDLVDWSFETTGSFQSGPQVMAVRNTGEQPHEALIMKLSEGMTAEDVIAMMSQGPPGGPPAEAGSDDADSSESGATDSASPTGEAEGDAEGDADSGSEGDSASGDAAGTAPAEGAASGEAPPEGAPPEGAPFTSAGGMGPIDPGEMAFVTADLTPGDYLLICFIPDPNDGIPHMLKGMVQGFSIE